MNGSIAVVGAPLRREIAPFLARIAARPERQSGDLVLYRGRLGGEEVLAVVLGEGARNAGSRLDSLLARMSSVRFLLIGVAGGLSPGLGQGAVIRGETVLSDDGGRLSVPPCPGVRRVSAGTVISVSTVVGTAAKKEARWLEAGRPERCVVDLESWTVASRLEQTDCPFAVVRAVSDTADEDLPLDFAALSDGDGRVARSRVLASLLRRPTAAKSLLELRSRVRECAEQLGEVAERWVLAGPAGASGSSIC